MPSLTFTQALEQAELLARQALDPALHERLSCAVALVRQGSVFEDDAGLWTVASATTPDKRYSVNGSCSCQDACYQAPRGFCKHKLATLLARKVQALMQLATGEAPRRAQVPTAAPEQAPSMASGVDAPQGLGEAPASVNCHVTIAGRQVQLTLRDTDDGRLLVRLAKVLERYPLPEPHAVQAETPPQCKYHGALKASTKAPGTFYCTKKLADGSYCPSRFPEREGR